MRYPIRATCCCAILCVLMCAGPDRPVEKGLVLTSPSGGSALRLDSTYVIAWTAQGIDGVVLKLSLDNGVSLEPIDTVFGSDPEWESYSWKTPEVFSEGCVIVIEDVSGEVADTSGVFALTNTWIEIRSPRQGAVWTRGSTQHITWSANDLLGVVISVSTDAGLSYTTLSQGGTIMATDSLWGDFPWRIPADLSGAPSHDCRIRMAGYEGEAPTLSEAFAIE
jgi:hypothetical protein